jgi:AcrR family transcriptional regulator
MPRKLRRRQQPRADVSREQILNVAMKLFAERGYTGTSISRLSKACGLPVGSIYWHFRSKEGVLWAVAERGALDLLERMPRASDYDGGPRERMTKMVDDLADVLVDDSAYLRLLIILSMVEHEENEAARRGAANVREHALTIWQEALRPIFAPNGETEGRRVADEVALVGRSVAIGGFVTAGGGSDNEEYRRILHSLVDLIRSRARHHFAEGSRPGAGPRRSKRFSMKAVPPA